MDNLKDLAIATWRLKKWVAAQELVNTIPAENSMRSIEDYLMDNGVKVIDLTGEVYDQGLAVKVVHNEDKNDRSDVNPIITEMLQPIVMREGSVIEFGQVVIAKNPKPKKMPKQTKEIASDKKTEDTKEETTLQKYDDVEDKKPIEKEVNDYRKNNLLGIVALFVIAAFFVTNILMWVSTTNNFDIINEQVNDVQLLMSEAQEDYIEILTDIEEENSMIIETVLGAISDSDNDDKETDPIYEDEATVYWAEYTVKENDTLYSICRYLDIDYDNNISKIIDKNDLTDENKIYKGQTLLLPLQKDNQEVD